MHKPYEKKFNHKADFRVKYCFYTEQEGGRKTLPCQGYRSDFWYVHEDNNATNIFIISPEFEDEHGNVILVDDVPVNRCGTARMWVIVGQRRIYHRDKIHMGTKGVFMEGARRVAGCEIIEILVLQTNPTVE